MELLLGILTGIAFGALLQQGRVLRFEKQVGAMLLRDMTLLKFMLTAIIVGMIGIGILNSLELVDLKVKGLAVGANLIGGAIFGIGWAVVGYCPGTVAGALGEGRWHAIFALLGMLVGAALYAAVYPAFQDTVLTWGVYGRKTLVDVLGVSRWILIGILTLVFLGLFLFFEKKKI
jgi:uncharacterized membrane protein YedE/YeeE